jgi:hypothetical protein
LDANYPSLSSGDDRRVDLVFQGRDPKKEKGWAPISAFVVEISPDGKIPAPMEIPGISSPVSRPTIFAATNGRVFAAWTTSQDGKLNVLFSRGRYL